MSFTSSLYPGEVILDDATTEGQLMDMAVAENRSLGLEFPEGRMAMEHAYGALADKFPSALLIPESEWEPRIKEMEERKTRLSDLVDQAGLPCKDQDGIPYCWIYGPTHAMEVIRVVQGQKMVILSAASAGSIIKGFRAQGGWGKEGLSFIAGAWGNGQKKGVVPMDRWPEAKISRTYDTAENWQAALDYVCLEWWELRPRSFAEHVSLLLRRVPAAVGLNYWSHEVTDYEPIILDGEVCIRFRNSWGMGWGSRGYSVRRGNKKLADDIVSPRVAVAS